MSDAGFRGVELCQLDVGGLNETVWGLGTDQWNHDFQVVLNKALDLGMSVGITSGTNWNTTNVPGLNPDSQAAMQSVFETHETFEAGTELKAHVIPTSVTTSSGCGGSTTTSVREVNQWIGAYAYEIVKGNTLGQIVDLNEFVTVAEDGTMTLDWTVPAAASYRVFYYWMQATAQEYIVGSNEIQHDGYDAQDGCRDNDCGFDILQFLHDRPPFVHENFHLYYEKKAG